jgi:hypothetical protein
MRIHVSRELWQNVLDWGRLGEFNARLVLQKTSMVQTWKRHIALVVDTIVDRIKEQLSQARAFWARFARLSDEAKRQVRARRTPAQGRIHVWDRASLKVLGSLRPRRELVRDEKARTECWMYASELDRFRAVYHKLVNGDFHPSIMVSAYYN